MTQVKMSGIFGNYDQFQEDLMKELAGPHESAYTLNKKLEKKVHEMILDYIFVQSEVIE